VFAVVNGLGTPTHTAVLDYLNQNEVPDLFVASGSTNWNQSEEYPFTYGFNADYVVEGAALAQYAADTAPGKKVCLLGQDDDFGDELIEGAELALGQDGLTHIERYSVSNQDVTAQIGALKAAGCEINLLATINGFTALAIGTAAQFGWFPQWFSSSSGADYPTLVGYLGEDVGPQLLQGFTGTNYLPALGGDDEWVSLFREINEEYNDGAPFDGNTIYGMSVAYLFAEALEAAGESPTRQSLLDAVASGDLAGNGILPLSFSSDTHAAYLGVGISQVDQGVQDYVGATYAVEGGDVVEVDATPVPLTAEGIPGS
jgi:ABC-type branched-subunit amino acid transport system substrate-binding protein